MKYYENEQLNKQRENNVISMNYYDSLIESIKQRREKISIPPKKIIKTKINEYASIISGLNKFETIVTKEIDCIKQELLVPKMILNLKNANGHNKDKYKNGILHKLVVSPSNAIQSVYFNAISFKVMKHNACKPPRRVHMSNTESPFCSRHDEKAQDVGQVLLFFLHIQIE